MEKEPDTKLLGPAALNEVYVYDSNILGIPKQPEKLSRNLVEIKEKGIAAGFSYLDAVSNYFVHEIEKMLRDKEKCGFWQFKMAKSAGDINIEVGRMARRYISSKNKKIDLRGPIFMSVELKVE